MTRHSWPHRFDAFVRRKSREARDAHIEGLRTIDDHSGRFALARFGSAWTRERFDGWFYWTPRRDGRSVNLVFVQSRDGNTGAEDPGALGGGSTDKHVIYEGLSRVYADAVMAGARTVTRSDLIFSVWHPEFVQLRHELGKPRHPAQVIVSAGGTLTIDEELIFNAPDVPSVLVTSDRGARMYEPLLRARPWVHVLATGPALDLRLALDRLARERDVRVVSCIGGRTLGGALIDAGLVQDLYLTTAPLAGGEPGTRLDAQGAPRTRLVLRKGARGTDAGMVFEHLCAGDDEPRGQDR